MSKAFLLPLSSRVSTRLLHTHKHKQVQLELRVLQRCSGEGSSFLEKLGRELAAA